MAGRRRALTRRRGGAGLPRRAGPGPGRAGSERELLGRRGFRATSRQRADRRVLVRPCPRRSADARPPGRAAPAQGGLRLGHPDPHRPPCLRDDRSAARESGDPAPPSRRAAAAGPGTRTHRPRSPGPAPWRPPRRRPSGRTRSPATCSSRREPRRTPDSRPRVDARADRGQLRSLHRALYARHERHRSAPSVTETDGTIAAPPDDAHAAGAPHRPPTATSATRPPPGETEHNPCTPTRPQGTGAGIPVQSGRALDLSSVPRGAACVRPGPAGCAFRQLAATRAQRSLPASSTPCSRTSDFHVEKATTWPSAPRARRAPAPSSARPAMSVSCAAAR
ncbi:MAG: hypothetical protein QOK40_3274 [Miltoncostaeaceae bacterium]|nr:hypothetical protein [Miltoncostaeaceae bacterium]